MILGNTTYLIKKVEAWEVNKLMETMAKNKTNPRVVIGKYDDLIVQDHPDRPFVKWMCWCKKKV